MAILFAFSLLAAACGSDDEPSAQPDDEPATTEAPADEPDDEPADEPDDEPADEPDDEPAAGDGEIGAPEVDTLRVCTAPAFSGLASRIANTQGMFEARGITFEGIACPSGPANAAALASNQVDIVGNTPDNMLGLRAADFDVVMFAQVVDTHFFDIVVRNGIEIDCDQGDWECAMVELDGLNAGVVARGAAAELIARALLSEAGLDPENTPYIATGLAGTTVAALASAEVDWAITFEPGLTTAQVDGIGYSPFALRNGDFPPSLDFPSLVLTTARDTWESSPNALLHYREALVEATTFIRDPANRDTVLAEMADFLGTEGEIGEQILDNNAASLSTTLELNEARVQNNVQFAFDNGRIPEVYDFATFAVGPDIDSVVPEALVPETPNVRVCTAPSFGGLPGQIARTQGVFEANGLTVEGIACESGPANAAALVGGEVEFVSNTPDNMHGLRAAEFDVVMFGQAIDTHFFDIIVSNDFEIDCEQGDWECTMAALDGTNVGVVANGAAAEQIARELYDQAGLNPDDAAYIATGLAGTTLAALSSGEIDWAITFEPGMSQGVVDGIGYTPFNLRAGDGPATLDWPSLVLTTSREFADANPNTLAVYRQSLQEAINWIRNPDNRDAVLAEMASFLGVEGELAEAILDNNVGSFSLNGRLQQARIENNVAYAVGRGILDEPVDFADFTVN